MSKIDRTPIHDVMIWGGVHGKRRLLRGRFNKSPRGEGGPGVPLVKSLQRKPIKTENGRIEAAIANPEAVNRGVRYVDHNLQYCISQPEKQKNTYEGQLVPDILQQSDRRDLVVDMHEQPIASDLDMVYVSSRIKPYVLGFASLAGISTIGVAEGPLHAQFSHGIAVDLSKKSNRDNVTYWRSLLSTTLKEGLISPSIEEVTIYVHGDLTDSEREQLGITNHHFSPFEEVQGARELLGVNRPVYTLCPKAIEVISVVEPDEVKVEEDIIYLPTLRSLA